MKKIPWSPVVPWIAGAALLLCVLYFALHGSMVKRELGDSRVTVYHLSISKPRIGEEFPVYRTTQGNTVTLNVTSDRPGEVHVHGYEKKITLNPGGEVALTFVAADAGMFPVHLHEADGSMVALATLEVQPK
jgi:hypothetical protein